MTSRKTALAARAATEAAREQAPDLPPIPGLDASEDELELWLRRVLVIAIASGPGRVDVQAAKALVELTEKRRARKPGGPDTRDPEQVLADTLRVIEDATSNV